MHVQVSATLDTPNLGVTDELDRATSLNTRVPVKAGCQRSAGDGEDVTRMEDVGSGPFHMTPVDAGIVLELAPKRLAPIIRIETVPQFPGYKHVKRQITRVVLSLIINQPTPSCERIELIVLAMAEISAEVSDSLKREAA